MPPPSCSIIQNLVSWASSEITGSVVIQFPGVLEYWNVGIMGLDGLDLF
jgi:hypothetical protein